MSTRDILSYCAGMFDADGCFTMYREVTQGRNATYPYIKACATIDIREKIIPEIFSELFGGSVNVKKKKIDRHSDTYQWRVSGWLLDDFITSVEPYLILKADQAALIKRFKTIRQGRATRKITEEEYVQMESCRLEMSRLNKTGVGKEEKFGAATRYTVALPELRH